MVGVKPIMAGNWFPGRARPLGLKIVHSRLAVEVGRGLGWLPMSTMAARSHVFN